MNELLTPQNIEYKERARAIADGIVRKVAAQHDRDQTYPWEVLEELKKARLTGVWIPQEYGGEGGGVLDLVLVIEELSRACGGVGVAYSVNALGSFPIILSGTEEQKRRFLPDIAAGKRLIAFGLSEKESGSAAGSMKTRAVKEGDHYVLNGEKKWNTGGKVSSINSIFAVTNPDRGSRGISALLVEDGMPGYRKGKEEDKMGSRCVPVIEVHFENCQVPVENLLGGREGQGFKDAMMTLDRARPGVAAQALGLAQGAFGVPVDDTRHRQ